MEGSKEVSVIFNHSCAVPLLGPTKTLETSVQSFRCCRMLLPNVVQKVVGEEEQKKVLCWYCLDLHFRGSFKMEITE